MKVLITGGAGFIGSALCKHLQLNQYDIYILDNFSFGSREFVDIDESHIFEGDILNVDFVTATFKTINPKWIIHLAAVHFIPYCNEFPFQSSNINIVGTRNILNAASTTSSVEKILFASTAAVYPISSTAHKEADKAMPMDIYGLSKLTGEFLCNEFFLKTEIPTVICRFFNAFGPNETNPHLIPTIQEQLNAGNYHLKLGNLEPRRDFIHTSDMANAVLMLMRNFHAGVDVFNLGQGIQYSVAEIIKTFEDVLGQGITVEIDPARVRRAERMDLLADISKIQAFTNWKPEISIKEGIRTLLKKQ